jgi:hypothetical protein
MMSEAARLRLGRRVNETQVLDCKSANRPRWEVQLAYPSAKIGLFQRCVGGCRRAATNRPTRLPTCAGRQPQDDLPASSPSRRAKASNPVCTSPADVRAALAGGEKVLLDARPPRNGREPHRRCAADRRRAHLRILTRGRRMQRSCVLDRPAEPGAGLLLHRLQQAQRAAWTAASRPERPRRPRRTRAGAAPSTD